MTQMKLPPENPERFKWPMLPKDFPPFTTVQHHFYRMRDAGLLDLINKALVGVTRLVCRRDEQPSAWIIDHQSVKITESGGLCGYDAGKKIKGRKRHIATDTQGNVLALITHCADIQDRDGGVEVIEQACGSHPDLACILADGGYAGNRFKQAVEAFDGLAIQIVGRPGGVSGFVVIARRWVVERTFTWLGRNRRLANDFETTIASARCWLFAASVQMLTRKLASL